MFDTAASARQFVVDQGDIGIGDRGRAQHRHALVDGIPVQRCIVGPRPAFQFGAAIVAAAYCNLGLLQDQPVGQPLAVDEIGEREMQAQTVERDRRLIEAVTGHAHVGQLQQGAVPLPAQFDGLDIDIGVDTPADAFGQGFTIARHEMIDHAQQQGVDLASVTGTGVGGRIRKEDVLKAAEAPATPTSAAEAAPVEVEVSPLRGTTQPMSRLRKVLAERAVASMQSTAQLTTVVEVDVTKLSQYRDRVKKDFQAKTGDKLSFLPFFALAAAEALQTYPIINSTVDGDKIVYPATENVSIAVDTERGLLTPVLRDAASKNLAQIAHEIADLAARTRDNKLKPDELAGGTFTLTNTGSRGALFDTPVVFLPQSAILGTGTVVKRPGVVTVDGAEAISVRSYVYLALSYDHRTIDGADAARFLAAVKKRLEDASFEANLGA